MKLSYITEMFQTTAFQHLFNLHDSNASEFIRI